MNQSTQLPRCFTTGSLRLVLMCFILFINMNIALGNSPNLVKDIQIGGGDTHIRHRTIQTDDGTIYFFVVGGNGGGNDGLYRTNGTGAGTVRVKQLIGEDVKNIAVLGNKLFFSYANRYGSTGTELWVSDGTTEGTHIIEDLNPGSGSGLTIVTADKSHSSLIAFNGYLYFGGIDGSGPANLYRTDGTDIELIKETFGNGSYYYAPNHFIIFDNRLFFTANISYNNSYIWSTDGTPAGTKLTISGEISGNSYSGGGNNQPFFKVFKNKLCFVATSYSNGHGLWCAEPDPVNSGDYIVMHHDIDPLNNYSGMSMQLALATESLLYLSASDYSNGNPEPHGNELWVFSGEDDDSDGEIDPPRMLKDINPGAYSGFFGVSNNVVSEDKIAEVNGVVVFAADDGTSTQLWKTDGTTNPNGTVKLKDFSPQGVQAGGSNGVTSLYSLTAFSNAVYFMAGNQLWRTDGTSTRIVTDTLIDPKQFSVHGDSLYMMADGHNNGGFVNPHGHVGEELFKLDSIPTKTLASNQWKEISLPCDAVNKRKISDIFADDIPSASSMVYGTHWVIYAYDTSKTPPAYVELGLEDELSQNQAYWMIQLSGQDITFDMPSMCDDTPLIKTATQCNASNGNEWGCHESPLATNSAGVQWQLRGNIFEKPVSLNSVLVKTNTADSPCEDDCFLDQAESSNILQQTLLVYNDASGGYDLLNSTDELDVWQGAWVATLGGADGSGPNLLIPKPSSQASTLDF